MKDEIISFPRTGMRLWQIAKKIRPQKKSIREKGGSFLGYPHTTPLPIGIRAYKNFIRYNSNHVGTLTRLECGMTYTRQMEVEVIQMLGELYGDNNVDGYMTSGGTEGNIYGCWLGYRYLSDMNESKVALITSTIVHQSIDKAVSIQRIEEYIKVPLDSHYQIDIEKFGEAVCHCIQKGISNILFVATSGYTVTGTQDNLERIEQKIEDLKRSHAFQIYIHIDAAIGGLVFPFLDNKTKYFTNQYVQSVTVDPHKMGYVPLSAGVFLCRKGLQKHVEIPINYVEGKADDTLTGSRNATSAVATWAVIHKLGYEVFRKNLEELLILKEETIKLFKKSELIYVFEDSQINMICFTLKNGKRKLPREVEVKYGLDLFPLPYKGNSIYCYKIYFMPHTTMKTIKKLYKDINKYTFEWLRTG